MFASEEDLESRLECFYQQAKAVCQILVLCLVGLPSSGVVYQIKQKAKNRYKYEVRRLRRWQLYITCHRIGSALSDARHRDFWKEVRLHAEEEHLWCPLHAIIPTLMGYLQMMTLPVLSHLNFNSY